MMSRTGLETSLRRHREAAGLSQQALADRVGVTRHAILSIEAGRQVPSTALALRLSRTLGCSVERLFQLEPEPGLEVRLASQGHPPEPGEPAGSRFAVGRVRGCWAAHRLPDDHPGAADAVPSRTATHLASPTGETVVRPIVTLDLLDRNVLVAGCAPLIGILSDRVDERFHDARAAWIPATSRRALDLLDEGLVHVAGLHYADGSSPEGNAVEIRNRFADRRMLLVNLTRWRQGLVVPPGNPLELRTALDLLRPGLRVVGREAGAAASQLVGRLLAEAHVEGATAAGPVARGHADVARLVRWGVADVGVAIESVALAAGLGFVPLSEERFDLAVPAELAERTPTARLLDALDDRSFRAEVAHLPGYDPSLAGHVTTLEVA